MDPSRRLGLVALARFSSRGASPSSTHDNLPGNGNHMDWVGPVIRMTGSRQFDRGQRIVERLQRRLLLDWYNAAN